MKKILLVILFIFLAFETDIASAEEREIYYKNDNGVEFTKEEYNFISDFYFDGYQDYMNLDDYKEFIDSNIMNGKIQIVDSSKNFIMPITDANYQGNKKNIKLSSSCGANECIMSITLDWFIDPNTRSYDLIGSLILGGTLLERNNSVLSYENNHSMPVSYKRQSNAFSSTYKLPSSGGNIKVVEKFIVANEGKVIASYQHATKNISLEESNMFNFSTNGYGAVFGFYNGVGAYYDNMPGVYLILG